MEQLDFFSFELHQPHLVVKNLGLSNLLSPLKVFQMTGETSSRSQVHIQLPQFNPSTQMSLLCTISVNL